MSQHAGRIFRASNAESEKAWSDIVAAYNAKRYLVTAEQVKAQTNAVMDGHSDSGAFWNALFSDEESFCREVFAKLTGETI